MPEEQLIHMPFYLDWMFWSFVVAFLALILSQIPPVHILLRRAKLEVEAYSNMHITHKVGNPNTQLHLILNNTGGRVIKVKDIQLQFKRGKDDSFSLPAKNYFQLPNDKDSVLFTTFKIKPNEEWAHSVTFLNFFSREDDKLFRQLDSNLRADIINKRNELEGKNELVEADEANVKPLLDFYEKKFRWQPGEYTMTLNVETDPPNALPEKHYRFVLFESDTADLSEYIKDYKYGFGVSLTTPKHAGVFVPLSEA